MQPDARAHSQYGRVPLRLARRRRRYPSIYCRGRPGQRCGRELLFRIQGAAVRGDVPAAGDTAERGGPGDAGPVSGRHRADPPRSTGSSAPSSSQPWCMHAAGMTALHRHQATTRPAVRPRSRRPGRASAFGAPPGELLIRLRWSGSRRHPSRSAPAFPVR
jgi:hypothetical protein